MEDDPRGLVLHQGGAGVVLEAWYYTRAMWERSCRPGITPGRCRSGPGGLVFHQGGAGGVLEAWYYTRAAGTDVIHGATTGWIPTAARGIDLQGTVINTGVAWVTAATGILVYRWTGILVFLKAQMGS